MGSGASREKAEDELRAKQASTRTIQNKETTDEFLDMRADKMKAELKANVLGKVRTQVFFKNDANFKVYTDLEELLKDRALDDKTELFGSSKSYLETILVQVMDMVNKHNLFDELKAALSSKDEASVKAFVDKCNWMHYKDFKLTVPKVHGKCGLRVGA
mmetsp:Transcript_31275/g.99757  ORF Transcript_31275/g.99757 Transcript_31275/m.99757 type:complete len:159 (+) Transcript_31275:118-594(+)